MLPQQRELEVQADICLPTSGPTSGILWQVAKVTVVVAVVAVVGVGVVVVVFVVFVVVMVIVVKVVRRIGRPSNKTHPCASQTSQRSAKKVMCKISLGESVACNVSTWRRIRQQASPEALPS